MNRNAFSAISKAESFLTSTNGSNASHSLSALAVFLLYWCPKSSCFSKSLASASQVGRVLAPGGRVAIFDKFLPDGVTPPRWRQALNVPLRWLATDINRRFADIVGYTQLRVAHDEPALWGGTFRVIQLVKLSDSADDRPA